MSADSDTEGKRCGSRTCARAGQILPRSAFYKSASRKDGLTSFCQPCQRLTVDRYRASKGYKAKLAAARKSDDPNTLLQTLRSLPHADRIERALELEKRPLTQRELSRICNLHQEQLGDALCVVLGVTVGSRNGTGPRVYFLKSDRKELDAARRSIGALSDRDERSYGISEIYFSV